MEELVEGELVWSETWERGGGAEFEREEEGPVEVMESRSRDGIGGSCLREMA